MPYAYKAGEGTCRTCGDPVRSPDNYCRSCSGEYEHANPDRRKSYERGGELYRNGYIEAANGFDGIVDMPTLFLAGERGTERVKITPLKGKKKKDDIDPMGFLF